MANEILALILAIILIAIAVASHLLLKHISELEDDYYQIDEVYQFCRAIMEI